MKVAFLGLGIMGRSMATGLVKAGYEVTVWNRSPTKPVEGAHAASTPEDSGDQCQSQQCDAGNFGRRRRQPDDVAEPKAGQDDR